MRSASVRSFSHTLTALFLLAYFIAGIFGPGTVLSTFISTGSHELIIVPSDGRSCDAISVITTRRHLPPDKRMTFHLRPVFTMPSAVTNTPATLLIVEPVRIEAIAGHTSDRPRDPPGLA